MSEIVGCSCAEDLYIKERLFKKPKIKERWGGSVIYTIMDVYVSSVIAEPDVEAEGELQFQRPSSLCPSSWVCISRISQPSDARRA